jgi:hypothetical protein
VAVATDSPVALAPVEFQIHIGFSTTSGTLSRLIRWFTNAPISHCFIVYKCGVFGGEMVLEASGSGFRVLAWRTFDRANKLVAVYRLNLPADSLRDGMLYLAPRLGDAYDTIGLVGYLLRMVFSLRRVPFKSRKKLVCSEAVALYLQHSGVEVGRTRLVTPRDLFELAQKRPDVFELLETGKAFKKAQRRARGHSK